MNLGFFVIEPNSIIDSIILNTEEEASKYIS